MACFLTMRKVPQAKNGWERGALLLSILYSEVDINVISLWLMLLQAFLAKMHEGKRMFDILLEDYVERSALVPAPSNMTGHVRVSMARSAPLVAELLITGCYHSLRWRLPVTSNSRHEGSYFRHGR
jgi:hypothetical protein